METTSWLHGNWRSEYVCIYRSTSNRTRNQDTKESLAASTFTSVARQMAASWKSRQKTRLAERESQLAAIEETGPLGF